MSRGARCEQEPPVIETLYHALFSCAANRGLSASLVTCLAIYIPNITPQKVLTLDFEVEPSLDLPLTWIIASFLSSLWFFRTERKRVELYTIRSDLEASCRILSESKFHNKAILTRQVLSELF